MRFVGGTGTHRDGIEYSKVNQFIQFEDVNIEGLGNLLKDGDAFYYPLSIVGLNGQFSFSNCRFDGSQHIEGSENNNVNGTNVYIGMVNKEHAATPNLINFDTCTFQHGIVGIFTDSSNGININRCWFENLDRAIMVSGTQKKSKSINIMNNLFGRSAGFRDDETYDSKGSVIVYSNSQINVMNNACGNNGLNGETVNFIRLETDPSSGKPLANLGANTFGNSFVDYIEGDSILEDQEQRFSYGVGKAINLNEVTGSTILTENAKLIYLSTSEPEIKTIDEMISFVSAGELICIRVDKGYVRFNESKNIYLGNMADPDPSTSHPNGQLTINQGGFALFVKSDDGNFRETYNLISYKNRE